MHSKRGTPSGIAFISRSASEKALDFFGGFRFQTDPFEAPVEVLGLDLVRLGAHEVQAELTDLLLGEVSA